LLESFRKSELDTIRRNFSSEVEKFKELFLETSNKALAYGLAKVANSDI
jgi:hypothetical protein